MTETGRAIAMTSDGPFDVFASHNCKLKPLVEQLVDQWEKLLDLKVFFDAKSIHSSERDLQRAIREAIHRSKSVVLLATPEAMKSQWVAYEVSSAQLESEQPNRLHVYVVEVEPVPNQDWTEWLRRGKRTLLATVDQAEREKNYHKLLKDLLKDLGREVDESKLPAPPPWSPPTKTDQVLIGFELHPDQVSVALQEMMKLSKRLKTKIVVVEPTGGDI